MKVDLTGKRFNKLVVLKDVGRDKQGGVLWLCKCDCGNTTTVSTNNIKRGHTKSCGCLLYSGEIRCVIEDKKFNKIWSSMKDRCNNCNITSYKNYGGRGITYDIRWEAFSNFKEDMYESYLDHVEKFGEKNTSLDRIDVNGNYCKENCRWITRREQADNTRRSRYVVVNGETLTMKQASEKYNINYSTIQHRLNSGKDIFGNDFEQL